MKLSQQVPRYSNIFSLSTDSYYEETSESPAYLNDSRFNHIELPWLANCKPVKIPKKPQQPASQEQEPPVRSENEDIEEPTVINEKDNTKILISQGILTKQDLFFVKSIEDYCSESTLIWFIESLKNKSIPNRFRRSCLARDLCYVDSSNDQLKLSNRMNASYYFDLVISK